ncbi:immediate early response gene 2 protein [Sarcoramphus papa]
MEEAQRLLTVSVWKLYRCRLQRGGLRLHRSLQLSLLVRAARHRYLTARAAAEPGPSAGTPPGTVPGDPPCVPAPDRGEPPERPDRDPRSAQDRGDPPSRPTPDPRSARDPRSAQDREDPPSPPTPDPRSAPDPANRDHPQDGPEPVPRPAERSEAAAPPGPTERSPRHVAA